MMFDINGKTAVVTGGASGIGLATVKALLAKGAKVVMSDINEELLKKECNELKKEFENVTYAVTDVSKEDQVKALIDIAVGTYGSVDIMVNNAGISPYGSLLMDESMGTFQKGFDINVNGVIYGAKHAIKQMIIQGSGGAVINTASIMGLLGSPYGTAYNGSKHAVIGMTKAWALEFASNNIRVNALCPAYTSTGMANEETLGKEQWEMGKKLHPIAQALNRVAVPEEMAHAIVFMIENTFYTGQALVVDGGYTIQ